ncbi:uncharacterized protein LOC143284149 [Babylonia areolata]|uniref:uncharacterized protein LOC143284149 n=1 Tax=Babylonia areolata TaxID=304850 RepID=UPI003FD529F1
MAVEKKTSTSAELQAASPHRLPGWVLGWFYATAAICTWDASFIILRPLSLPGGALHSLWKPYSLYIVVDQRYLDVNDPFVYGISLFNYAEVILNVITIFMHYRNSRHTIPLAFTVSTMTFWKTLFYLYGFSDLGGGGPFRVGNDGLEEFFLVVIPNGMWVLFPFLVMVLRLAAHHPCRAASGGSGR